MYLHLGQSVVVPHKNILGIFDLDNSSWAFKTREFLERAEQEGRVVSVCDDLPRSFVLVGEIQFCIPAFCLLHFINWRLLWQKN